MTIKLPYRPWTMSYGDAERLAHDMVDGNHIVVVEVFDHPWARRDDNPDKERGVWLIGEAGTVYDQLESDGYEHHETQYEINHTADEE